LALGDGEIHLVPFLLPTHIEEIGRQAARDLLQREVLDQGGELTKAPGEDREHVEGKGGVSARKWGQFFNIDKLSGVNIVLFITEAVKIYLSIIKN
jgi:hypothetical protein